MDSAVNVAASQAAQVPTWHGCGGTRPGGDMSYKPLNQSHIQLTLQLLVCHQHTKCRCLHELCSVPLLNETLEKQRLKGECVFVWRRLLLLNKEGKLYNQKRKTLKYTLR